MKAIITTLFVLAMLSLPVLAHERHVYEIDGTNYMIVVGNIGEPVYVGDKSGVEIRVMMADPANITDSRSPNVKQVTGLEKTLKVDLISAEETKTREIEATYNTPGSYEAVYYPMSHEQMTYRLHGTINEILVDLKYTCSGQGHHMTSPPDVTTEQLTENVKLVFKAGSFGCPSPRDDVMFPKQTEMDHTEHMAQMQTMNHNTHLTLIYSALLIAIISLLGVLYLWFRD